MLLPPTQGLLDTFTCHCKSTILAFAVLYITYTIYQWTKIDDGKCDIATTSLLQEKTYDQVVPKECIPIVRALEEAPTLHDEASCAAQMREIVANEYLKFSTLVDKPGTLLRCSPGNLGSNGALWTRFTVQYNLYAGTIVAMGNPFTL